MLYECLCFYLFVVCQNEDLKHVAGIVTRLQGENFTRSHLDGEGLLIWRRTQEATLTLKSIGSL